MLFLPGLDSKVYWERLAPEMPIPEVACPDPACLGRLLRAHGWYQRFLDGVLVSFRRLLCPGCRVSHALLPVDVCAYQDLRLAALERAVKSTSLRKAAQAAGADGGSASRRRARRWRRSRLWIDLLLLLPAAGTVEELNAVVGQAVGKLVRLRRWLWSIVGYLLGGPVGLFRRGRPCGHLRGGST